MCGAARGHGDVRRLRLRRGAAGVYAPLYIFEQLLGENVHRSTMSLTSLECQVSELGDSDACPRPTTGAHLPADPRRLQRQPGAWATSMFHRSEKRICLTHIRNVFIGKKREKDLFLIHVSSMIVSPE